MDSPNFSASGSEAFSDDSERREKADHDELPTDDAKDSNDQQVEELKEEVNRDDVIALIRNMTTLFDLHDEQWTADVLKVVHDFVSTEDSLSLFIFMHGVVLEASLCVPVDPVQEIMYFLKQRPCDVTMDNFYDDIAFGNLNENVEGSILNLVEEIYAPVFFSNTSWPENMRGKLFEHLHDFLSHLTDIHYKLNGLSVPYLPQEAQHLPVDDTVKNKAFVRRIEGVMAQWSRQLRVAISDATDRSSAVLLTVTDEYDFWRYRWESLTLLREQLRAPLAKRVIDILTLAQSSLQLRFRSLLSDVETAINEALSNVQYIKILVEPASAMQAEEQVANLCNHIPKLLHLTRGIWLTSPHYNSCTRIATLCKNLSNQVIIQCRDSVDVTSVFDEGRTRTAVEALRENVRCCRKFKIIYDKIAEAHTALDPTHPWDLDNSVVFDSMNAFIQRNDDLVYICKAMMTFGRLDEPPVPRPVLGGTLGTVYVGGLDKMEERFEKALAVVSGLRQSILDVMDQDWSRHFTEFRNTLADLELVLLNLLSSVMEQSATIEDKVRCLQAFYHHAQRPAIYRALQEHTETVWRCVVQEVHAVRQQLLSADPPRPAHAPQKAGGVLLMLLQHRRLLRLKELMTSALWLPVVSGTDNGLAELDNITKRVETVAGQRCTLWTNSMDEGVLAKLDRPLLVRSSSRPGLLEPNFDLSVTKLANESMFWELLGRQLPRPAQDFSAQASKVFLLYENVLAMIMDYNSIISALSDEEKMLFKDLIQKVDSKFGLGLFKLTWTNDNASEFIADWCQANNQLLEFVEDYKMAIRQIAAICIEICEEKLISISPEVVFELPELEEVIENYRIEAFTRVVRHYNRLRGHINVIYQGFQEVLATSGPHWNKFILKLDSMLEEALLMCVKESMQTMLAALQGEFPLLHTSISLQNKKIKFNPSLQRISSLGNHFLAEVVGASKVLPRIYEFEKLKLVGVKPRPFYQVIDSDEQCRQLQRNINDEVEKNVNRMQDYLREWEPFRRLWETDINEALSKYQQQGTHAVDWDTDIAEFNAVSAEVLQANTSPTVHFTRLDAGPLKLSVVQHCSEWKQHLCKILLEKTSNMVDNFIAELSMHEAFGKHALQGAPSPNESTRVSLPEQQAQFLEIEHQYAILEAHSYPVPVELLGKWQSASGPWTKFIEDLKSDGVTLELCQEGRVSQVDEDSVACNELQKQQESELGEKAGSQ